MKSMGAYIKEAKAHIMFNQKPSFQVGDQVIHWAYGLGKIIQLDEKELSGHIEQYYVVKIRDMTLWVPINETGESSMRCLTPARDFQKLLKILSSPGEPLSDDRLERKKQLMDRLKDGTVESICRVIRDLALNKRRIRMNENDKVIQNRAMNLLLDEWSIVLSVSIQQAGHELQELLGAGTLATQS